MRTFRNFLYLVIAILCLEVIKTLIERADFDISYFLSTVIIGLQFLLALGFVFVVLVQKLYRGKLQTAVAVISYLVLVGLMETLFSWWFYHPSKIPDYLIRSFRYYYYQYDMRVFQYDQRLTVYDPVLHYILRPGARARYSNAEFDVEVCVNSLGLRDDSGSVHQPSVICLGDSYAMGWGVNQQETYPELLQHLTGRKVLNAGISSYGTARELLLLDRLDTTNLEYLIIQYCANDFVENDTFINSGYRLPISDSCTLQRNMVRHRYNVLYYPGKHFLLIAQAFLKQKINNVFPVFNLSANKQPAADIADHVQRFVDILYHSTIDFRKVKVIITHIDDSGSIKRRFINEVQALLRQSPYAERFGDQLRFADFSEVLSKEDYFILDGHIKPSGHRKVAEKLAKTLQSD